MYVSTQHGAVFLISESGFTWCADPLTPHVNHVKRARERTRDHENKRKYDL